jgi:hypothetical protein
MYLLVLAIICLASECSFSRHKTQVFFFLFFHPLHTQIKESKRKEREGVVILSAREST